MSSSSICRRPPKFVQTRQKKPPTPRRLPPWYCGYGRCRHRFNRFEDCAGDGFNQTDVFRQAAQSADSGFVRINQQCAVNACQNSRRLRKGNTSKPAFKASADSAFRRPASVNNTALSWLINKWDKNTVERHIIAAQIGNPSDVVQRRNQMRLCPAFHGRTDTGQFSAAVSKHSRDGERRFPESAMQDGRPKLRPTRFQDIEANVFGGKCLFQTALAAECEHIGRRATTAPRADFVPTTRYKAHQRPFLQLNAVRRSCWPACSQ